MLGHFSLTNSIFPASKAVSVSPAPFICLAAISLVESHRAKTTDISRIRSISFRLSSSVMLFCMQIFYRMDIYSTIKSPCTLQLSCLTFYPCRGRDKGMTAANASGARRISGPRQLYVPMSPLGFRPRPRSPQFHFTHLTFCPLIVHDDGP